jgi:hypothetical protein
MKTYAFPAFDELKPSAELPDPFIKQNGTRIRVVEEWAEQRDYLKAMLAHYMYGNMPPSPDDAVGEVLFRRFCYQDKAIAETVKVSFGQGLAFVAEIIRPNTEEKVPVITWNQFTESHGCPAEEEIVVRRGYAVAEFDKEQLAKDSCEGVVGPLAQAYPEYNWGAIAMWAWMQSRLIDYLATTDYADMEKIVATGHSRGGKVALCCSIYDERVAICAPNNSGCGGVGCYRFLGGRLGEGTAVCETAGSICDAFPFWWTDEFGRYGKRNRTWTRSNCQDMGDIMETMQEIELGELGNEELLPFDLHFARALIAPRAIISTEALGDTWANTFGTQIVWRAAQEVFDFLNVPRNNAIHFRDGVHQFQAMDWHAIIDFADEVFYGKKSVNNIVFTPDMPDPQNIVSLVMSRMDWRNEKLKYSWRNPREKVK